MLVILFDHSLVLISKLCDMLSWVSIIVEEGRETTCFLFLLLLLSLIFELELHEMNLLLEVVNVLVLDV